MTQTISGQVVLPITLDLETGEVRRSRAFTDSAKGVPVPASFNAGGYARRADLRVKLEPQVDRAIEALSPALEAPPEESAAHHPEPTPAAMTALARIASGLPVKDDWRSAASFMELVAAILDDSDIPRPDHYDDPYSFR